RGLAALSSRVLSLVSDADSSTRYARSGFRLRASPCLTPAERLKLFVAEGHDGVDAQGYNMRQAKLKSRFNTTKTSRSRVLHVEVPRNGAFWVYRRQLGSSEAH